MIKAILFDFDGVIIDSEPLHTKAEAATLNSFGISYPKELFHRFKGSPDEMLFEYVAANLTTETRSIAKYITRKYEFMDKLLEDITYLPGVVAFLERVKSKAIQTVLVTSSARSTVEAIDKKLNFLRFFEVTVTAEDTVENKPHPEPYLKALKAIHCDPKEPVVIEDSTNGVLSGKRAGCQVYALPTTFTKEELLEVGADRLFENYEEMGNFIF